MFCVSIYLRFSVTYSFDLSFKFSFVYSQCISTYGTSGMVCQQCDTGDIPLGGVPLAGSQSSQGRLGPIGAVDQSQSSGLAVNTGSTFFSYDQGSSRYIPTQSGAGYDPYGSANYGNYGYQGGYQQQGQYAYRRRRRSVHKHVRPIDLKLSHKIKENTRVVQFDSVLKGLNEHLDMHLDERGNAGLFGISHDTHGRTFVETKKQLKKGSVYNLLVRGKLREVADDKQRKAFNERFGDFNFKTKINVKVL